MTAILFGSISTVADTSELQRRSFNEAFAQHGLDWDWSREEYRSMLDSSGGAQRVAEYAASRGQDVDAAAVHRTKSELFQQHLSEGGVTPRPGVVETAKAARAANDKVAFVTATSPENVAALLAALEPQLRRADFDLVVDASTIPSAQPDKGAAYAYALEQLAEPAAGCIAVEDNTVGLAAAAAAGLPCVAFPNENTAGLDFSAADRVVDHLDLAELEGLRRS